MTDREKLTDAMNDVKAVENLLRRQGQSWYADILSDAFDTLALLREQEKIKVVFRQYDGSVESECGNCGLYLDKTYSVCPKCGKELDWNA